MNDYATPKTSGLGYGDMLVNSLDIILFLIGMPIVLLVKIRSWRGLYPPLPASEAAKTAPEPDVQ